MHEYSIVQSLIDSVEAVASRHAYATVHHLYVQIGELAGVDCDLLQTAYDTFVAGTICEHAPMTIERVAATWTCPDCGQPILRGAVLRCTHCNTPAQLAAGDEIILRRVEMEVV